MDASHIYHELKEIHTTLTRIQVDVARNTDSLDYHIKRTDLLEKKLDLMEADVLKLRGFFSIGGWLVALAATILTVWSRFK